MAKRKTPIKHDPIVPLFAERLRELRHARGMTQAELGRAAHVTETYISKLETAQIAPGVDLVARLSRALTCSIADLLPSAPPELDELREQVRQRMVAVLQSGDRATIELLLLFLGRIGQSTDGD